MSALLQEKLQRSRRAENERMSTRSSCDMLTASPAPRSMRSPSPTQDWRPRSSGGSEAGKQKKGLGVKEMEHTLSTLHKQNFDLKLELFHRRERQTALEDRLEKLEREKMERDDVNDLLIHELEKRDKAVEEAVAMIVVLEARVEQLLCEREMVRQVEFQGTAYPRIDSPVGAPTAMVPKLEAQALNRMPSFVSDRSENTEHLRNVYLGTRDSTANLPRLVEGTPDTTRVDPRLDSPALSMLSESSFISIYGRRTAGLSPPPGDSPPSWDATPGSRMLALESPTKFKSSTPSKPQRPAGSRTTSGQFHNITDVLDMGPSPLQRLEKLDAARVTMRDLTASPTSSQDKDRSPFARPPTSQAQRKTKQEKREALDKVLTHGHFSNPQMLPPTPDTLSSTTLRHFKNSNDTLSKEQGPDHDRGHLTHSETTTSQASGRVERGGQPASTTGFDSRKHVAGPDRHFQTPSGAPQTQHNRRVSTTSSVDTWLRESLKPESPDALDPMSSVSQANASSKTGRVSPDLFSFPTSTAGWAAGAMFGALGGTGYLGAGGKNPSATPIADMLDAIGASMPTPPLYPSGRQTPNLGPGNAAPPLPNRRSSLARPMPTVSDATYAPDIPQSPPRPSPAASIPLKSPMRGARARSNSTDVRPPTRHLTEIGLKQDRAMTVPPKQVHFPPPAANNNQDIPSGNGTPKQRHYPPTASHPSSSSQSRPRSRGLNTFFRRSSTSADQAPAPPASAPPTETAFKLPSGSAMGIPSWVRRGSVGVDDERASATPPPILRNKGGVGVGSRVGDEEDGGVELEIDGLEGGAGGGGVVIGAVPGNSKAGRKSWGAGNGSGSGSGNGSVDNGEGGAALVGGGKRKWLGLGRVSSLRNRGA